MPDWVIAHWHLLTKALEMHNMTMYVCTYDCYVEQMYDVYRHIPLRIGCLLAEGSITLTSWGVFIPQQKSWSKHAHDFYIFRKIVVFKHMWSISELISNCSYGFNCLSTLTAVVFPYIHFNLIFYLIWFYTFLYYISILRHRKINTYDTIIYKYRF